MTLIILSVPKDSRHVSSTAVYSFSPCHHQCHTMGFLFQSIFVAVSLPLFALCYFALSMHSTEILLISKSLNLMVLWDTSSLSTISNNSSRITKTFFPSEGFLFLSIEVPGVMGWYIKLLECFMPKHTIWMTLFHTWAKHLLAFNCCYTPVGLTTGKMQREKGSGRTERKKEKRNQRTRVRR